MESLSLYDEDSKRAYAKRNGVHFDSVAHMDYYAWTSLRFNEALRRGEPWAIQAEIILRK